MRKSHGGTYPANWGEIARRTKEQSGWNCIRCGRHHSPDLGYCLTVHHLDMNPSNNRWWNLLALCQRCHLQVQAKVELSQIYMFEHSAWIKTYVAGYYASLLGLPEERAAIEPFADVIIQLGQGRLAPVQTI